MKHFEMTENTREFHGRTLYQIRALVDLYDDVKAGDLGGWLEDEVSLESGWVYPKAIVLKRALLLKNSRVYGGKIWFGDLINSVMYEGLIEGGDLYHCHIDEGHVSNGELNYCKIYGGTVCGGKINSSSIYDGFIAGGEIRNSVICGGRISDGKIINSTIYSGTIDGNSIVKDAALWTGNHIGFANIDHRESYLMAYVAKGQIMISYYSFADSREACFPIDEFYQNRDFRFDKCIQALRPAIEAKLAQFVQKD
jgi:hypothetical protein